MIFIFSCIKNKSKRWLTSCLLLFCIGCKLSSTKQDKHEAGISFVKDHKQKLDSIKAVAETGDLVFRNGTDEVSRAARSFNRIDTSFSHCGFLLIENDTAFVYHAIGGSYNPSQKLRRDPIDSFCFPGEVDRLALYRYDLSKTEKDSLTSIIHHYYKAGLRFDLYFNFQSDEEMYCSEFIYKCLARVVSWPLSQYIKLGEWPYSVTPDMLYLHEKSHLIKRIELKVSKNSPF